MKLSDLLGKMADDLVDPAKELEAEKEYIYPKTELEEQIDKASRALLIAQILAEKAGK